MISHREIFHFSFFSFQESVELKIWLFLVEKNHLGIHIFPSRVVEIIQEVADTDKGDVTAHQNKLFVIRRLRSQEGYFKISKNAPFPPPTLYCPPYLLPEASRVASSGTMAANPPTPTKKINNK